MYIVRWKIYGNEYRIMLDYINISGCLGNCEVLFANIEW